MGDLAERHVPVDRRLTRQSEQLLASDVVLDLVGAPTIE
jgi:hypothetical protein